MELLPTMLSRDGPCAIGPTGKGKRPLRALGASDKIDAIQRVNDGESKASVARDIGVPESTLRGWCKNEDKLRYMSSRHSTPDTDKSSDGLVDAMTLTNGGGPEKRVKYEIPSVMNYSHPSSMAMSTQYPEQVADLSIQSNPESQNGLDLSRVKKEEGELKSTDVPAPTDYSNFRSTMDLSKNLSDLSKYNADLLNSSLSKENKQKMETGANMSMSAISPLSGLNHLSGLSSLGQNHMGLSFNELATNLSLIAQLNPSLSALTNSINTGAKALRSIRSPKPGHNSANTGLNLSDKQKSSSKSSHHNMTENYLDKSRSTRSSHSSFKDPPVDETLWYWFKKQQAMMSLANSGGPPTNPLGMPHIPTSRANKESYPSLANRGTSTMPPLMPPLDALNKNSWFWQYYKQFTGNLAVPDENGQLPLSAPNPTNKTDSYENILYSQLTKEKSPETSPVPPEQPADFADKSDVKEYDSHTPESCPTPPARDKDNCKNSTKARAVLDNLLFNNNNNDINMKSIPDSEEGEKDSNAENEFGCEVSEALEHGEKFLKWLESCQEPSVTRMQVHQLKGLLNNIKANAERRSHNSNSKDRVSRRK